MTVPCAAASQARLEIRQALPVAPEILPGFLPTGRATGKAAVRLRTANNSIEQPMGPQMQPLGIGN
jgi:hypothetical protein